MANRRIYVILTFLSRHQQVPLLNVFVCRFIFNEDLTASALIVHILHAFTPIHMFV